MSRNRRPQHSRVDSSRHAAPLAGFSSATATGHQEVYRDGSLSPLPFRHSDAQSPRGFKRPLDARNDQGSARLSEIERYPSGNHNNGHRRPHAGQGQQQFSGPDQRRPVSYADLDHYPTAQSEVQGRNTNLHNSREHVQRQSPSEAAVERHEETVQEPDYDLSMVDSKAKLEAEEAERERKRRRREAIRAEATAKGNSSLLDASNTSTPNNASPSTLSATPVTSRGPSPGSATSPVSPASGPQITGLTAVDEDRSSGEHSRAQDGPSAAAYDPLQDMEADRLRGATLAQDSDLSATAYDETAERRSTLLPVSEVEVGPSEKKVEKEFDMFDFEMDIPGGDDDQNDENAQGRHLDERLLGNWDDPYGYYKVHIGERLHNKYKVKEILGKGMFANVVRASDIQTSEVVAIKVIRHNDAMKVAGHKEIKFIRKLNEEDPDNRQHIVLFKGSFEHKHHLCMVFENLNQNLRDLLKSFGGHGITLQATRKYARQMFLGLCHLKKCDILHADLKPDNILVTGDGASIKICDFGTAADKRDNNEITPYLVSRFYRAPEIILGMKPLDFPIDMWSIACTLFELWTGKILFTGRSNNQMLRSIMEHKGPFSEKLLRKGELSSKHFYSKSGRPVFLSLEQDKFDKDVVRERTFQGPYLLLKARVNEACKDIKDPPSPSELNNFLRLLEECTNYYPEKRITPEEALKHVFLKSNQVLNGSTSTRSTPRSTIFIPRSARVARSA